MKQRIAIIGSTGSIGNSLLSLIKKKNFNIIFLAANTNINTLFDQAKQFDVRNLVITNYQSYKHALILNKNKKIKIFNSFENLNKIINQKLDYVMSAFSGIDGLKPTYKIIKYTRKIAIANKESIICAWPILKKELNKYKTEFIPVDSEHFSIWSEIKNDDNKKIKKIYLTASGGPILKIKSKKLSKIGISEVLRHPTWKMGKKISVDSATMMNKCFEIIEAKNIFEISYKKIDITIHPDSYAHAIIEYNNGLFKIIFHDTTMKIPIFNTLFSKNQIYTSAKKLNYKKLNNLNFQNVSIIKYPIINIMKLMPTKHSLFETILVCINDTVVESYLNNKLKFSEISKLVLNFAKMKEFKNYKNIYPKNVDEIINLNKRIKSRIFELINQSINHVKIKKI